MKAGEIVICNNTKELLAELKKYMDLNGFQINDIANGLNKSNQNISQALRNGNPTCNTLFNMLDSINTKLDVNFIKSDHGDTE